MVRAGSKPARENTQVRAGSKPARENTPGKGGFQTRPYWNERGGVIKDYPAPRTPNSDSGTRE